MVGGDADRLTRGDDGLLELAEFPQAVAEVGERLAMVGLYADGFAPCGDRLCVPELIGERAAQIVMGIGIFGRDTDRLASGRHGFVEASELLEHGGDVGMRLGIIGPDFDGAPRCSDGLVALSLFAEHVAEVAMRLREARAGDEWRAEIRQPPLRAGLGRAACSRGENGRRVGWDRGAGPRGRLPRLRAVARACAERRRDSNALAQGLV